MASLRLPSVAPSSIFSGRSEGNLFRNSISFINRRELPRLHGKSRGMVAPHVTAAQEEKHNPSPRNRPPPSYIKLPYHACRIYNCKLRCISQQCANVLYHHGSSAANDTNSGNVVVGRKLDTEKVSTSTEPDSEIKIPAGFKIPEPQRFAVASGQLGSIAAAGVAPLMRLGAGLFCLGYSPSVSPTKTDTYAVGGAFGRSLIESSSVLGSVPRPAKPLELYEFEGCPFCRKVREMVTVLDLDVLYYPCPKDGPTYRPKAFALGGKKQFPYMVDPNTGVSLYESDAIIEYMAKSYGDGSIPLMLRMGAVTAVTESLALLPRWGKGSTYVAAKKITNPIQVWAYESSPFCKIVREALCELELPHLYHSTGRGSPKRQKFFEEKGRFQVPYIEDPNTGVNMFESAAIVEYLYATYAGRST